MCQVIRSARAFGAGSQVRIILGNGQGPRSFASLQREGPKSPPRTIRYRQQRRAAKARETMLEEQRFPRRPTTGA